MLFLMERNYHEWRGDAGDLKLKKKMRGISEIIFLGGGGGGGGGPLKKKKTYI